MSFDLYKKLRNLNVKIEAVQGKLDIEAPQGVLTNELVSEIKEHKEELLDFLTKYKRENITTEKIPKATIKESYPLSSAQKRLWIMCQFKNGSIAYNMPTSIELASDINIENFIQAIETVVDRHEILRTVFKRDASEEVRQWILSREELGFKVEFKDYENEENKQNLVAQYIQEDAYKEFDLENEPLLRVSFLKLEEDRYVFYYNMHHIISDGWSLDILSKEVMYCYESLTTGIAPSFEPLNIQYKDYSEWQLKQLESSAFQKGQEYWLNTLSSDLPTINLPSRKIRPAIKTFNGQRLGTFLPKESTQKLKQFCETLDGSLFMGLLSSWNVLLYRYTMEKDLIIGVPVAGREHLDLENQIGFYVNTLTLRNQLNPKDSFIDFFKKVKDNTLAAYEHQAYPFDMLIEKLQLTRDTSRSAVFDVMLTLQNAGDKRDLIPSKNFDENEITDLGKCNVKFDINIAAEEIGEQVYLRFDYNEDVYEQEMMMSLLSHYKNLVQQIVENTATIIEDITFLSAEETKQQLALVESVTMQNKTEKTVIDIFREKANAFPTAVAVVFEETTITYKELEERSNQFANFLKQQHNVLAEDLVAINLERSEWIIIVMLGILKCDAAYVPIDNEYPETRIKYIKEDSKCKVCIEAKDIQEFIATQTTFSSESITTTSTPESTMYVIYTSGSTGNPKGVVIAHASLLNYVDWFAKEYKISALDSSMLVSSPSFDGVLTCIYGCLLTGATLHIVRSQTVQDPFKMINYISDKGITFIKGTPVYLHLLFENTASSKLLDSETLRLIITGGDKADTSYIKKVVYNSDIQIINHYGPTETTIGVSVYNITKENFSEFEQHISIGSPINQTSFFVLDANLALMPKGAIGELYIGGKSLAKGYLNKSELTAATFIKNPFDAGGNTLLYKTGDLVRWLPDNNIEFIGRKDNQVKIRGYRVELGEIEKAINECEGVDSVVVICHKNQQNENTLKAFVISQEGIETTTIKKFLEQRVPSYLIPENFIKLSSFPLTDNKKIDRKHLATIQVEDSGNKTIEYIKPTNDTQRRLIVLWGNILNTQQIGIKDDFFLLGGHSLSATRLITQIHKEFDVILGIEEIFLTPVLEEMATTIKGKAKVAFKEIEVADTKPHYPLSSSHKRLYFLQQFDTESIAYNMPVVRVLSGDVHAEKIEDTIIRLINRHEILRTSFVEIEGEVMQLVHTDFDFKLDTHAIDNSEELEAYIQEYTRPFDLSKAPLIRSSIVQIGADEYAWIVDLHHIISDGSSQQILINDFLKLYNEEELPELRLQYKDFSEWQNNLFETGGIQNQIEYWQSEFAVPTEKLNLPTDFPRPQVFTFQGTNHIFTINKEDSEQLKALGLQNGASLQMTLMTILFTLLHKYTQQEDVVIGCGINGRRHSDLDTIVGMFVNTICIRCFPETDQDFQSFYKQVISKCILAYENQDLQFEDLVQLLNVQREPSGNPIFDVSMVLQNYDRRYAEIEELQSINMGTMNRLGKEHTSSKFDLTWFIYDSAETITIEIEYYTAIFKEETIVRMAEHFQNIIQIILKKPTIKINDINLLSSHEIEKIATNFVNGKVNTDVKKSENILQLFEHHAAQTETAIAVEDDHGSLTYEELQNQSNQLAQFLVKELHLTKETGLGLLRSRTKDITVDILGIMKAGGTYVPLDINSPEDRLVYILENSDVEVLITEKNLIEFANKLQWRVKSIKYILCTDTEEIYNESGRIENEYMDRDLWEHVGETAVDEITAGGWMSSYTGEYISEKEMAEYSSNAYLKLAPILHENMKVLEIGCSSGLTMFPVAPKVKQYIGTDISQNILELTQKKVTKDGHTNISLERIAANEIDQLSYDDFDLIIINSVVQSFNGHNYLRDVLRKATKKMKPNGYIFLGDLMDEDRREDLIHDLENFKINNTNSDYNTKLDWSNELFISKAFLEDLTHENLGIAHAEFSEKICTIKNELTKFRYDALLTVNKAFDTSHLEKSKYQIDRSAINKYDFSKPSVHISGSDLAYIIYTSGSTGKPKGVMIEHKSIVDLSIWQKAYFNLSSYKTISQMGSLSFDASIGEMVMALTNGCKLQMISNEDFLNLIAIINEKEIDVIVTVPSLLKQLDPQYLEYKSRIVSVGEKCPQDLYKKWNLYCTLINGYGPTEYTVYSHVWDDKTSGDIIPIGKPRHNLKSYILDESLNLAPVGIAGEICLSGYGISRGYLNNVKKTFESFVPNVTYLKMFFKDCDEIPNNVIGQDEFVSLNAINYDIINQLSNKTIEEIKEDIKTRFSTEICEDVNTMLKQSAHDEQFIYAFQRYFYEGMYQNYSSDSLSWEALNALLKIPISENSKGVDFGCGNGELVQRIFENGVKNIVGLDINPFFVNNLKKKGIESHICKVDTTNEYFFEMSKLNPNSIDFAISILTLDRVQFPKNLMKNMAMSLKDDGRFVLGTLLPIVEFEDGINTSNFSYTKYENKLTPGITASEDKYYIIEKLLQYNLTEIEHYTVKTRVRSKNGLQEYNLNFFCGIKQSKVINEEALKYTKLYKTGDMGRWLSNGDIEFLGRKDEQIKLRGFRIELGEIETILHQHHAIDNAVVISRINEENETELIAYLVCEKDIKRNEIKDFLNQKVPAYMIPTHIVFMESLPLNNSGKTDRQSLPNPMMVNEKTEYVEATDEIQIQLVEIWKLLLSKEKIGIKDNFFDLGGHSLKATRLASFINSELGIKIKIKDIFTNPTIEELGKVIKANLWIKDSEKASKAEGRIIDII
ncbi:Tyrocidine synthase 3 [Kordia antarctica]|uniref:Tyrocidine synthase 3 n=1 Tax=Kordia antarctica TaxID=1218801 RepID=A0A7L4ZFQ3_9FLAO|nr:non-ribosomal peptide synthetase [Kordia antarctica]QHI35445.1 Tyrocidine synthase 3 [Kordia antarctica]